MYRHPISPPHAPAACISCFATPSIPTFNHNWYKKKPILIGFRSNYSSSTSIKCFCIRNHKPPSQGFSVLKSDDIRCDTGSIWSTMALYIFTFHIPLSFGGLSIVAQLLHQPHLDHQTQALSVLVLQTLELVVALVLLRFTARPQYELFSFYEDKKLSNGRNWLLASALGIGFLVVLVFCTSFIADRLIGPKEVNNPILKEIISSGPVSVTACFLVYCIVTPFLEETVYRGFLLRYLASTMDWQQAVIISSAVFSAAHLSGENFVQLFIIGSVLGCSYCWTGKLSSSVLIHSMYNALTLLLTFTS